MHSINTQPEAQLSPYALNMVNTQNNRIWTIVSTALLSITCCATAALIVISCISPLGATLTALAATAIIVAFVAGILFMPTDICLPDDVSYREDPSRAHQELRTSLLVEADTKPATTRGRLGFFGGVASQIERLFTQSEDPAVLPLNLGLPNPSMNCFMNAALQCLFQDKQVAHHLITQLKAIADDPQLKTHNPFLKPTFRFIGKDKKPARPLVTEAVKDELKAAAVHNRASSDPLYQEYLALKQSDPANQKPKNAHQLYITLSLGEASESALELIDKWITKKEMLSYDEACLLRIYLCKLLDKPPEARLNRLFDLSGAFQEDEISWIHPGIDVNSNLSIFVSSQAESNDFAVALISSLDHLTRDIMAHSHNPFSFKQATVQRAYRLPAPGSSVPHFDDSLLIPEAINQSTEWHTMLQLTTHGSVNGEYHLDSPELLSQFLPSAKPVVTYNAEYKNIPGTALGDTVSDLVTHTVTLPKKLMIVAQANSQASVKPKIIFSDPKNFRITLPVHVATGSNTHSYELTAFTVHSGASMNSGHYFTYSRAHAEDGTRFWVEHNDPLRSIITEDQVKAVLNGELLGYSANMLTFSAI